MTRISEAEFARLIDGIREDRATIIKHNPIGTDSEILLWMLLSCLISYLNLSDIETPCLTGVPTGQMYRDAIVFILKDRREQSFDIEKCLNTLTNEDR